ncbi:hypothetical protein Hanom_Chr01g00013911 [Helianthus anomalus]
MLVWSSLNFFYINNSSYLLFLHKNILELIAKIDPEVWADLPFSSKMTLFYQIAPNVCKFLPFSSKPLN